MTLAAHAHAAFAYARTARRHLIALLVRPPHPTFSHFTTHPQEHTRFLATQLEVNIMLNILVMIYLTPVTKAARSITQHHAAPRGTTQHHTTSCICLMRGTYFSFFIFFSYRMNTANIVNKRVVVQLYRSILQAGRKLRYTDQRYFKNVVRTEFETQVNGAERERLFKVCARG